MYLGMARMVCLLCFWLFILRICCTVPVLVIGRIVCLSGRAVLFVLLLSGSVVRRCLPVL